MENEGDQRVPEFFARSACELQRRREEREGGEGRREREREDEDEDERSGGRDRYPSAFLNTDRVGEVARRDVPRAIKPRRRNDARGRVIAALLARSRVLLARRRRRKKKEERKKETRDGRANERASEQAIGCRVVSRYAIRDTRRVSRTTRSSSASRETCVACQTRRLECLGYAFAGESPRRGARAVPSRLARTFQ